MSCSPAALEKLLDKIVEFTPVNRKRAKGKWTLDAVKACAKLLYTTFPPAVHALVASEAYKGGTVIIGKTTGLWRPKKKDVEANSIWVKAIKESYCKSTVSPYFVADVLLLLDQLMRDCLLKTGKTGAEAKEHKAMVALKDARTLCKICSVTGKLCRDSWNSHSPAIQEIKEIMKKRKHTGPSSGDDKSSAESDSGKDESKKGSESGGDTDKSEKSGESDDDKDKSEKGADSDSDEDMSEKRAESEDGKDKSEEGSEPDDN
jgi:hypothetical protein